MPAALAAPQPSGRTQRRDDVDLEPPEPRRVEGVPSGTSACILHVDTLGLPLCADCTHLRREASCSLLMRGVCAATLISAAQGGHDSGPPLRCWRP